MLLLITMLRKLSQNLQQAGENPSIRDNDHCVGTHQTSTGPVRSPPLLGEGAELRRKPRLHLPGSFHRKTRPGRVNNVGLATLNDPSRH